MKTETITTDILAEDFEIPSYNADLQYIIEHALIEYEDKPKFRHEKREFKNKLNELITEYNERRGMRIYAKVK